MAKSSARGRPAPSSERARASQASGSKLSRDWPASSRAQKDSIPPGWDELQRVKWVSCEPRREQDGKEPGGRRRRRRELIRASQRASNGIRSRDAGGLSCLGSISARGSLE